MADTATKEAPLKGRTPWRPFTVEMDQRENCGEVRVTMLKKNYRGRWSNAKRYSRYGGARSPGKMGGMPDIPGAHFEFDPKDNRLRIYDPKLGDDEFWAQVTKIHQTSFDAQDADLLPFRGFDEQIIHYKGDDYKSLVCEMVRLVDGGVARVVDGELPTESQIEAMAGDELYDPGGGQFPGKPVHKKDYEAWLRRQMEAGNV